MFVSDCSIKRKSPRIRWKVVRELHRNVMVLKRLFKVRYRCSYNVRRIQPIGLKRQFSRSQAGHVQKIFHDAVETVARLYDLPDEFVVGASAARAKG